MHQHIAWTCICWYIAGSVTLTSIFLDTIGAFSVSVKGFADLRKIGEKVQKLKDCWMTYEHILNEIRSFSENSVYIITIHLFRFSKFMTILYQVNH